ncbi:F-box/kelch-repeat protein At5g15710 isoform X2 [Medicago truncatula]|uniref:F-box/kelch-repeat protein At5g15710 isoform X2 n=1 Tax=Medicago truncatula TaxID=3880 RepID=UPI001967F03C|nr:F-box/kelch-repeat protein At5g15710-like isoform X2 [Medicago truncatula]
MNTQLPNLRRLRSQSNLPPSETLPDEVMAEILSRLPVRSLMQIKCVCKSWNTIISDPKFIKMHLNRSARNPNFSVVSYETPSFDDDDHRFVPFPAGSLLDNPHITFPKDPYYLLHDKDCREVIGSCNGLVCLLGTETYTKLMLPPGAEESTHSSNVCVLMNSLCFSHDFNKTDFVIWKMTEFGDDRHCIFLKMVIQSYSQAACITKQFSIT